MKVVATQGEVFRVEQRRIGLGRIGRRGNLAH